MCVNLFIHSGAFGCSDSDTLLSAIIRDIATQASQYPEQEWAEKYGTDFENDVFMMHQFCWCEKPDCHWCEDCECDGEDVIYFVDDMQVSSKEYTDFYHNNVPDIDPATCTDEEWSKYEEVANLINSRRYAKVRDEKQCGYCKKGGKSAPNFHYKPLDLRVWWYKYIGRSVETNKELTVEQLQAMHNNCLASLK